MEAVAAAGVKLGSSKPQIAMQAEMAEARVPLPYHDQCAHLLIPLNKCRVAEYYLPWKCEPERHACEKCQGERRRMHTPFHFTCLWMTGAYLVLDLSLRMGAMEDGREAKQENDEGVRG